MDEEIKDKLDGILKMLKKIYGADVWVFITIACIAGCFSCHYTASTRDELRETNKKLDVIIEKFEPTKTKK